MLYALLGRMMWRIFRGYFKHKFPNARRNLTAAGIGALVLIGVAGAAGARRRSDDFRGARRS